MTKLTKYIPHIAIALIIFFAGRFSKDDDSKELEALRKKERTMFQQQIIKKQVEIQGLIKAQQEIERQRIEDSIRFAGALERNQIAYNRLKKKYNEINLNRADAHTLDSLLFSLYPNSR